MDDAVEQYFKNLHSQGKDPKTVRAYKVAVEEFRKSCPKKFLNEICGQDLIDFMGWLRKQPPKLRKDGPVSRVVLAIQIEHTSTKSTTSSSF
jgi:Phage integrase, N-terminal SAM-like domain